MINNYILYYWVDFLVVFFLKGEVEMAEKMKSITKSARARSQFPRRELSL